MNRALRVFIPVGILFVAFYVLDAALIRAGALPHLVTGPGGERSTGILALLALVLAALIGSAILSAASVVAIVATVQRRQRGWTITLIGALALFYASVIMVPFPNAMGFVLAPLRAWTQMSLVQVGLLTLAVATLTGLLVLIYTFIPVQNAPSPTSPTTKG